MTDPNTPEPGAPVPPVPPATPPAPGYSAPPPAAPAYGQADSAYGQPATGKTNTLAIVSLVASLVGFATGVGFIAGIICGHISLGQIKKTGEQGRGLALAGVIIGYIGIVLSIIVVIVVIAGLAALYSTGVTSY
ncbi:DUF4190 domain-containing protein [Agromyces sp. ISL-38]|uniref:DUF4190 domain-containing protein n=1 Tax=Agromyces sp. ISL-38 TaxID=2819107 RepID=UPI001BE75964|nr:DUF4190 domain-containing protein [Agromyces sp. ISL-38]MBT2498703.1 DUF4190 domain-containing protein [Agromyces sp. ISL-38]MBT2518570.1 DUF4190 domain-containing protein [Streptomyces sp. ISL-90]